MATSGPAPESPLECALRLANGAGERELIGSYAVAGAFAFIYYGEPFETKDLDLMIKLSLTPGGLVDVAPVYKHFVDGGAVAEGQFLRLSRILVGPRPSGRRSRRRGAGRGGRGPRRSPDGAHLDG